MEITNKQIDFLDKVCDVNSWFLNRDGTVNVDVSVNMSNMNLNEIPVKFGRVYGHFNCSNNNLTTLKNIPNYLGYSLKFSGNNLTDYFKNIKEEDFTLWENLNWEEVLQEYPFLINITKNYKTSETLPSIRYLISRYSQTKLYLKD